EGGELPPIAPAPGQELAARAERESSTPAPGALPVAPPAGELPAARRPAPAHAAPPRPDAAFDAPAASAPSAALRDGPSVPSTPAARATAAAELGPAAVALPALRPRDLAASSLARAAHAASEDAPLAVGLRVPPSVLERAPRRAAAEKGRAAPPAVADLYSNRFGPRKTDALERFGGTAETERAV